LETITHNLTAVLIQLLCFKVFLFPLNVILTIIFAFTSHFFTDALSQLTYHTPEPHKEDKFWVTWHIIIFSLSILSIIILIIPFWLGILFVNIPDLIDWFILRPIDNRKYKENPDLKWRKSYLFHPLADWIRKYVFFWLPEWTYKKASISVEIIIILVLSILIFFTI
jgi:hypothetical protein